jgi:hypothetical protein
MIKLASPIGSITGFNLWTITSYIYGFICNHMSVRTDLELNRKSFRDHRDFLLGVDGGGRRAEAISKAIMKTLAYIRLLSPLPNYSLCASQII